MVGGTSILAWRKPDRSRQRKLDGYGLMTKKRNQRFTWLRFEYFEKSSVTHWLR
jgi:hypothetical protein